MKVLLSLLLLSLHVIHGELLDPCKCETSTFDVDQLEGSFKYVLDSQQTETCSRPVSCLFYVAPRPNYTVSIQFESYPEGERDVFFMAYYKEEKQEVDMIPMNPPDWQMYIADTPAGVGVYFNYTRPANSNGTEFEILFSREAANETTKVCPSPVLLVNSTVTIVTSDNWPSSGCAFRVKADHPISMQQNCHPYSDDESRIIKASWKQAEVLLGESERRGEGYWNTLQSETDIIFKDGLTTDIHGKRCQLSFFAVDFNPCNCSTTNFTLTLGKTVTLRSPGFPNMYCPQIECVYKLNISGNDPNQMKTFVANTVHLPKSRGEKLFFTVDGKHVELEKFTENNLNVLAGDSLEIKYSASSVLSSDHGFFMDITAYTQPHDCRCPSDTPKPFFQADSLRMDIAPHCTFMVCRFSMINKSKTSKVLNIAMNYTFASEMEMIHVKEGQSDHIIREVPRVGEQPLVHYSNDFTSNGSIMVTYVRVALTGASNQTSMFNMAWHWVTNDECSCGKTFFEVTPYRYTTFYSARYPQDYCNNLHCTYTFLAPEGYRLLIGIPVFETESHRDYLTFFENGKILRSLSGYTKAPRESVQTVGRNASAVFKTDSTVPSKGFKVQVIAVLDPDYVSRSSGFIALVVVSAVAVVLALGLFGLCFYEKWLCFRKRFSPSFENPSYSFSTSADEMIVVDVEKD